MSYMKRKVPRHDQAPMVYLMLYSFEDEYERFCLKESKGSLLLFRFSSGMKVAMCNAASNTSFKCTCAPGWEGDYCERMVNFSPNVTCENESVCRASLHNASCECISGYSIVNIVKQRR